MMQREQAEVVAAAVLHALETSSSSSFDLKAIADIVEQNLQNVSREQEQREHEHLSRLLSVSPAVIYSFLATGSFAPSFVSDNLTRIFGYAPREYLENPDFWRSRVHPEDLARVDQKSLNSSATEIRSLNIGSAGEMAATAGLVTNCIWFETH